MQQGCVVGQPGWDADLDSEECPEEGVEVVLLVYDLSQGMAASMSQALIGKHIDGIWHTSIVVYGKEWWFGGGICRAPPGTTPYGRPVQRHPLGRSHIPPSVFREFVTDAASRFSMETYDLLKHNCNHFSNELSNLLVGEDIPQHITSLPEDIMGTPLGQMLWPMIEQMQAHMHGTAAPMQPLPSTAPPSQPLGKPEAPPAAHATNTEEGTDESTRADAVGAASDAAETFELTVKTVFKTSFVVHACPTGSVLDLKRQIHTQEGYLLDTLKLVWTDQRVLEDSETLTAIGLPERPVVIVVGKKPKQEKAPAVHPSTPKPASDTPTGLSEAPPTPASEPAPPEAAVQQLMAMGFTHDQVVQALRSASNNIDRAIEYLLSGAASAPGTAETAPLGQEQNPVAAPPSTPAPAPASTPAPPAAPGPDPASALANVLQDLLRSGAQPPAAPASPAQLPTAEKATVDSLTELGFPFPVALEAFLLCDKNHELAANYLFEHGEAAVQEYMAAQASAAVQATSEGQRRLLGSIQGGRRTVTAYEDPAAQQKARQAIPVKQLEEQAAAAMESGPAPVTARREPLAYRDVLMKQLLHWFKTQFFTWFSHAKCDACQADCHSKGGVAPNGHESQQLWAGVTELWQCNECARICRFPRINNPEALLDTRTGRCGEWANCFVLCCRALGYTARWVQDFTDHVWAEYYSESARRWIHLDPCECAYDNPKMYEAGWGKKLTYVVAHSNEEVLDVTRRYTDKWEEVLQRRTLATEDWLRSTLATVQAGITGLLPAERLPVLRQQQEAERHELEGSAVPVALQPGEQVPRQTGDLEWRRQRGEMGPDAK